MIGAKDFSSFEKHQLSPAHVCVQFSFLFGEVKSVALNACRPEHVALNFHNVYQMLPRHHAIWKDLKLEQLIDVDT